MILNFLKLVKLGQSNRAYEDKSVSLTIRLITIGYNDPAGKQRKKWKTFNDVMRKNFEIRKNVLSE